MCLTWQSGSALGIWVFDAAVEFLDPGQPANAHAVLGAS